MIYSLVFLAFGGGECRQVVRQAVVQSVQYQYAAVQPVIAYQPYAITYPAFVYAAGESARLAKLEEIAEQQLALHAQQAELIQALRANGQVVAPGGPIVSQSQAAAAKIVNAQCLKCHAGATAKGKLDLSDLGKLTVGQKLLIVDKIESNEMPPPPAPSVVDDDFQAVRKWALEDRAAVRAFLKTPK